MYTKLKDFVTGKAPLGAKRSSSWPKVRAKFLKSNPSCAVCGSTKKLEVHHITPFHIDPSLELEESNLITLCESKKAVNCHLFFGHLCDYKSYNKSVKDDAFEWHLKLQNTKLGG
jgi:hypothetical protein